jgi:DNA modification methylase
MRSYLRMVRKSVLLRTDGRGELENYVDWMRVRVEEIHRLLKPTGSFYLHCDWHASHYLKVMCDEIFGQENFRNEIVWHYRRWTAVSGAFQRMHDVILFYTKGDDYVFNPLPILPTKSQQEVIDRGWNVNVVQEKDKKVRQLLVYDKGKMEEAVQKGEIKLSNYDRVVYRDVRTTTANDVWTDIQYLHSQAKERYGYPTQKPEALLERIIHVSSNPYDLVFDCFCACGTTLAAAQKLGRRWLGIDVSPAGCKLVQNRVSKLGIRPEIIGLPRTIEELKQLSPREFQNWVIGAAGGKVSDKMSRDMGIDGYTFYGLYGEKEYPIQVKRIDKAGRGVVDTFETAMRRKGFDKGYIVAFDFTKDAYEEVARAKSEGLHIELVKVSEIKKRFQEGFIETLKGIGS